MLSERSWLYDPQSADCPSLQLTEENSILLFLFNLLSIAYRDTRGVEVSMNHIQEYGHDWSASSDLWSGKCNAGENVDKKH